MSSSEKPNEPTASPPSEAQAKSILGWIAGYALMPWPHAWAWMWAKVKNWPIAAIAALVAILALVYIKREPVWNFLANAEDGKIIVNSPTVYTRQRLVNDRLDQARWLRTQLESTENEHSKEFKNIDRIRRSLVERQAGLGDASSQSENSANEAPKKIPEDDIAVEATTMALFRAKNAYREEVRSEITQTELDDRHDIRGNTIFRLTFDASVIAGTRKDSVAAITIRLSHNPEMVPYAKEPDPQKGVKKLMYAQDYESLYFDWARYFQKTVGISMKAMPGSINSAEPQARLRLLFTEFLIGRICEFVESKTDFVLSDAPSLCDGEKRQKAKELLRRYTNARLALLSQYKDSNFIQMLRIYESQKQRYEFPPIPMADLLVNASALCAQSNKTQIRLWELNVKLVNPSAQSLAEQGLPVQTPPSPQQNQRQPSQQGHGQEQVQGKPEQPNQENQNERQAAQPSQRALQNRPKQQGELGIANEAIGCPFYPSLQERLISGVLLYENLYSIVHQTDLNKGKEKPPAGNYDAFGDRAVLELVACQYGACYVEPARLSCFAADFIRSEQNAFYDPFASEMKKIGSFLTLKIIGREVNDCTILVLPSPKALDGKPDPGRVQFKAFLNKFIRHLNEGTDAFAYSVTPKNLTENIATASETRDAFELLYRARGDKGEVANFLRKRSEQNRALVAHPIVVGFGSPNDARAIATGDQSTEPSSAGVREIDFGWIVAARMSDDRNLEQVDGQYSLTSFISVPGWWRTVEASIKSCWISRAALSKLDPKPSIEKLCPNGADKTQNIMVRLPSAIPEISRKLDFDVLQEPSIYNPQQKELFVGRKGSLLLEGARLWRSTEVTVGGQRADKITVLPNMEGILAEFKCVLPPAGERQERLNSSVTEDNHQIITRHQAQVWTSEGVTDRVPVVFVWANYWENLLAECLNPQRKQALQ